MGVDTDELAAIEAAMQAAARTILPQPSFDDDVMLIVPKQQPASKSKKAAFGMPLIMMPSSDARLDAPSNLKVGQLFFSFSFSSVAGWWWRVSAAW